MESERYLMDRWPAFITVAVFIANRVWRSRLLLERIDMLRYRRAENPIEQARDIFQHIFNKEKEYVVYKFITHARKEPFIDVPTRSTDVRRVYGHQQSS